MFDVAPAEVALKPVPSDIRRESLTRPVFVIISWQSNITDPNAKKKVIMFGGGDDHTLTQYGWLLLLLFLKVL